MLIQSESISFTMKLRDWCSIGAGNMEWRGLMSSPKRGIGLLLGCAETEKQRDREKVIIEK